LAVPDKRKELQNRKSLKALAFALWITIRFAEKTEKPIPTPVWQGVKMLNLVLVNVKSPALVPENLYLSVDQMEEVIPILVRPNVQELISGMENANKILYFNNLFIFLL
jgi:hypothetical protein